MSFYFIIIIFSFPVRQIYSAPHSGGWKLNFFTSCACFHPSMITQDFWDSVRQKSKIFAGSLLQLLFTYNVTSLPLHAEVQPCSLPLFLGHFPIEGLETPLTAALLANKAVGLQPFHLLFCPVLGKCSFSPWSTLSISPNQSISLLLYSLQDLCTKSHSGDL